MTTIEQVRRDGITVQLATIPGKTRPVGRSVARYAFQTADGQTVDFCGFSFGRTRLARTRAAYEVYERLFTYRPFRREYLGRVFPQAFTLLGDKPTSRIPSRYLFIREGKEHSAGSGSGAHTSIRAAIEHGVREIVERDLLCRWWYEDAFRIQQVGSRTQLKRGLYMSSWTVSGGAVPFCVSVIFDDAQTVFLTGSKVSPTLSQARMGAEREAFLLYDTLPRPNAKVSWRVGSLRGPLAKARIAHFRRSIDEGRITKAQGERSCAVEQLAAVCGKSLRAAKYAVMADLPHIKVAQVHCPGWMTKAAAREKYQASDTPPDPFC